MSPHFQSGCTKHARNLIFTVWLQIPVALAMWNQVGAEAILLIRTYAFFNRNNYVLALLVSALGGVVAYQLFVDISRMDRRYRLLSSQVSPVTLNILVLHFPPPANPVCGRVS